MIDYTQKLLKDGVSVSPVCAFEWRPRAALPLISVSPSPSLCPYSPSPPLTVRRCISDDSGEWESPQPDRRAVLAKPLTPPSQFVPLLSL